MTQRPAPRSGLSDLPQLVASAEALQHNIALMADYCTQADVLLAPHAKTTMTRQLVDQQVAAGAWGLTVATPRQARVLWDWGVRKIILANVLVDRGGIDWVAEQFLGADSEGEFLCYVESPAGVALLDQALTELAPARKLSVLLEIGVPGARTGVRTAEQALDVAAAVSKSERLSLVGTAAFEGVLGLDPAGPSTGALPTFLNLMHDITVELQQEELFDSAGLGAEAPIVSAGGSSYFDLVVTHLAPQQFDFDVRTILRSGCYVSHDHGVYHRTSPLDGRLETDQPRLRAALTLIASVWAVPEPGLMIAGFGRRDVPYDDQLPIVLDHPDWQVQKLWDQHAQIVVPQDAEIEVGEELAFGISHPCGAFDRWREIPLLDEQGVVVDTFRPAL